MRNGILIAMIAMMILSCNKEVKEDKREYISFRDSTGVEITRAYDFEEFKRKADSISKYTLHNKIELHAVKDGVIVQSDYLKRKIPVRELKKL